MSLFQICYGPEILAINNTIYSEPGVTRKEIIENYQINHGNDISSLVDAVLNFLLNLELIKFDQEKGLWPESDYSLEKLDYIVRLNKIKNNLSDISDHNLVFSRIYYDSFVIPNQLFVKDLYYVTNLNYEKVVISHEKINAWKRIMEYLGLGFRMYGGFYALPQPTLMKDIVNRIGSWEGPLQQYFEKQIHKYIPCNHNGSLFRGVVFSILNLNDYENVTLSKKQDLPFSSFGDNYEFNWIKVKGELE
jgi:hypothetical protein